MAIGEIIRSRAFGTVVPTYNECSSACVLILAAGIHRSADTGKVGIHRPTFDDQSGFGLLSQEQATAEYNKRADEVHNYLRRMGVSDDLFLAMLRVPSGQVRYLTAEEIRSFGLEGEDPAYAEWLKAYIIAKEGRENYEINESFFATLKACSDSGIDSNQCDRDVRPRFKDCVTVSCARQIQDRMIEVYSRRQ